MLSRLSIGTTIALAMMVGTPQISWGGVLPQNKLSRERSLGKPSLMMSQAQKSNKKIICAPGYDRKTNKHLPTTYFWTPQKKTAIVRWESKAFKGYTPEERCQQVSPKFDEALHNGSLKFITNGRQGNQSVICTAREYGGSCVTTLMTLRSTDNSLQILEGLIATLSGRSVGPIRHSSGVPQRFYEVDIANFLETAKPE